MHRTNFQLIFNLFKTDEDMILFWDKAATVIIWMPSKKDATDRSGEKVKYVNYPRLLFKVNPKIK